MKTNTGPCDGPGEGLPARSEWHGKPYNFFGDYLTHKYGSRVLKLPINARFSCPNRDGTVGSRGCIFCADDGSASPTSAAAGDIRGQMVRAKEGFRRGRVPPRYIAYFQAFTNTYAPVERLRGLYDTALMDPEVVGLMIGTRPDCLSDEVLDLISRYRRDDFELWLEIGMQSAHDKSLEYLDRGHGNADSLDAIERAAERDIPVCAHVILGIPGETWEDMMATARCLSDHPVLGVKIHHLHVIRGTRLDEYYRRGQVRLLSFREYVSAICDFIERLRPDILVHRLIGDREVKSLEAPLWALHKGTVIKAIEDEFRSRGTHQGFFHVI